MMPIYSPDNASVGATNRDGIPLTIIDGIPFIDVKGTPIQPVATLSLWGQIVAEFKKATGSLFEPRVDNATTITPDERGKTPTPAAAQIAPLLAIALAAGGAYMIWKAVK